MLPRLTLLTVFLICFSASTTVGVQQAVSPDEPTEVTMNERLSLQRSLESLAVIESALNSFKKLTAATADALPKQKLAEIGNTGWEMQNLGFINHVNGVKGTLLKQDYLLKRLTYELAQRKVKSGELDRKELIKIKREYQQAEKAFQSFSTSFRIID